MEGFFKRMFGRKNKPEQPTAEEYASRQKKIDELAREAAKPKLEAAEQEAQQSMRELGERVAEQAAFPVKTETPEEALGRRISKVRQESDALADHQEEEKPEIETTIETKAPDEEKSPNEEKQPEIDTFDALKAEIMRQSPMPEFKNRDDAQLWEALHLFISDAPRILGKWLDQEVTLATLQDARYHFLEGCLEDPRSATALSPETRALFRGKMKEIFDSGIGKDPNAEEKLISVLSEENHRKYQIHDLTIGELLRTQPLTIVEVVQ